MAEQQDLAKKLGASPKKLVLIGVLAVVLVAVLYLQYGRQDSGDSSTITTNTRRSSADDSQQSTNASESDATSASYSYTYANPEDEIVWKSYELAAVIEHDPFALPASFPQPLELGGSNLGGLAISNDPDQAANALKKTRADLERLKFQGASMIMKQNDSYIAVIGDETIHVGDEINGFKVIAIDPNGVQVEWKAEK